MKTEDFIPTAILRPFIQGYKIIECNEERVNRILPGTSLALAFRLKGQNAYVIENIRSDLPRMVLSGLRKTPRHIQYAANTSTLVVLFKACGAAAFFKEPLHEFFSDSIALDCVIRASELEHIEERLAEAENPAQCVAIVEHYLLSKLRDHQPDQLVLEAIRRLRLEKGKLKIKDLADTLCISNDAFEKRFRKTAGASPKQFAYLVRMMSIIRLPSQEKLWHQALEAGYYDQAHFNKDFKLFTGQTPSDFYQSPTFW